jgi:hypothetical protein
MESTTQSACCHLSTPGLLEIPRFPDFPKGFKNRRNGDACKGDAGKPLLTKF